MQNEPCFLRRVARLLAAAILNLPFTLFDADLLRLVICALRGCEHGVSVECRQVYVRY